MSSVGFVGLGVMGGPMAMHLQQSGADLTVWNRTATKADPHRQAGAKVAADLQDLASGCEIIFLCISRTEDVVRCVHTLADSARAGTLFVDHSTILPAAAKDLHRHLQVRGMDFVDAPVTGGSMGAQKGQLTVFCGGNKDPVAAAISAMAPYTKRAEHVGASGAGQMTKMANQIAVAGSLLALCESLSFAQKAGLDLHQTWELLSGGAAGSWSFDNYGPKVLAQDWSPGFKVKDQLKDLVYCEETAQELSAAVPGTILVEKLLRVTEAAGYGENATASLFLTLSQMVTAP
jgi:3-hydroxyisobutyrate dehydrogenase